VSRPSLQTYFSLAVLLHLALLGGGCKTVNPLDEPKSKWQQKRIEKWQKKQAEKQSEKKEAALPMRLPMGKVHMVHPGGEFVLIHSKRKFSPEPGTEIHTYGPDGSETAKLEMSAASKGEFITADIISGKPARGDSAVTNYIPSGGSSNQNTPGGSAEKVQVLE